MHARLREIAERLPQVPGAGKGDRVAVGPWSPDPSGLLTYA
ncbi:hypothetical protein [Kitasatospora sp. A2-31]|nr:hypothetical protein [Kitasatospora sp. A2-31]